MSKLPLTAFLDPIPKPEARAVLISIAVGITMLAVKFLAYAHTGSSAILSDALEGIVNVVASTFAMYSLATAHRPADEEHPYGHGKVEFLSAGFEGGMIVLAALLMFAEAAKRIHAIHRQGGGRIDDIGLGLFLLAIAMAVHAVLGAYLITTGKRQESITLEADGWHLLTDAATSGIAMVSLVLVRLTGWAYADPLGAVAIGIYISLTGLSLVRRAAAGLMDEQDRTDGKLLREILDAHVAGRPPQICSYHKLRHRHSGRYHWVDFHLLLPARWDIQRGHLVASSIEYEIEQAIGVGNATAHVEPCAEENCPCCEAARKLSAHEDAPVG
jgi:cation diffusion facilitator family transporter